MNRTDNSAFAGMDPNIHTTQTNSFYYVYPQSVVYPPLTKLFVGQIPKTMQTEDVMKLFQQSYPVQSAHIIRDRVTGEHKGCAFIFVEASIASQLIETFHNRITCEGMSHPLQVKVANNTSIPTLVPLDSRGQPSYPMASYLPAYSTVTMTEMIPSGSEASHLPIYPSCFFYTPYTGQGTQGAGESPLRVDGSPEANLFVYNIPSTYGDEDLFRLFERFGTLLSAKVSGRFLLRAQVIRDHESGNSRGFGFVNFATKQEAEVAIREMNHTTVEGRLLTVQVKKPKRWCVCL